LTKNGCSYTNPWKWSIFMLEC